MPSTTTTKPKPISAEPTTKRAFAYLRVSSEGQVNTDYSDDGLSIAAQRAGSEDKAQQLEAEIVREYSDPGKSAYVDLHKRLGFLEMLDELKRRNQHLSTRVDYVIVWALNRWARNQADHWRTRELVRDAGARIISITEPMIGEDSAAAFLYESMIATQNQFQSMQTSENVKRGMRQKAIVGGTIGVARFGYLNAVDHLPDGRRIAIVNIDPERGHYVTLAFRLYATGEYSVSELAAELDRLGVRTRATAKRPAAKLGTSVLQKLLRNPYYLGKIVYKRGTPEEQVFDGRHEPLIDQETFDAVQRLLDEKRTAGERPQVRRHYLRGSVYCGECGKRLVYGLSTGKGGRKYAYYFCAARINGGDCPQRVNIRPELIETAIERYYAERPVQLTAADVKRRSEAIEALAAVSEQAVAQVRTAKTDLIQSLETRQEALVDMRFAERSISPALFKRKQDQLQAELDAAHESLAQSEAQLAIDTKHLKLALELAEDVAAVYSAADQTTKRRLNQAFFAKLLVVPDWDDGGRSAQVARAELSEPYATLLAYGLAESLLAEVEGLTATSAQSENRLVEPDYRPRQAVSNFDSMVPLPGFEPGFPP